MHETIAAEHGVEARRRERQGLCVALLKIAFGHQLAGKLDRCYGEIESNRLRAVLQRPRRQHAGATTHIQDSRATCYVRCVEHGLHRLACDRAEGRIVAADIRVPAR